MLSETDIEQISSWARKISSREADTITQFAIAYIEENKINWQSKSGQISVSAYINNEMHYKDDITKQEFFEGWSKHNTSTDTTSPFEILPDELPRSGGEEMEDKINNSSLPFEVKEILKEMEDKSYKSPILSNLDNTGRLRLIRKAKILAYLRRKQLSL